jgi:hypothetical protein
MAIVGMRMRVNSAKSVNAPIELANALLIPVPAAVRDALDRLAVGTSRP